LKDPVLLKSCLSAVFIASISQSKCVTCCPSVR
jgi:hypothetical protein